MLIDLCFDIIVEDNVRVQTRKGWKMYLCVFILIVKFLILLFLAFLNYVLERSRDIHFGYWKLVLICFVITLRTLIRFSAASLIGFTATAALVLLAAA
jgi:hypothetical protein